MSRYQANLLEVEELAVEFATHAGPVRVVRDVSFAIPVGRTVALLGESGCGKSVTGRAILNLIDPPGRITHGAIRLRQRQGSEWLDILKLEAEGRQMEALRWAEIAMIFQEPRASLTPVYTVGDQIIEVIRHHQGASKQEARGQALALLKQVGIPAAERRLDAYPHQLSGGMCQRVMIAMALACNPRLIIADEPTTALDVTIQAQVLDVLKRMQRQYNTSILLITHDMGVVAEMADEVLVMYLGRIVERGPVAEIFDNPQHPYTRALFASAPDPLRGRGETLPAIPGTVPDPANAPRGCPFRGRCAHEMTRCMEMPPEVAVSRQHAAACWLVEATAGAGADAGAEAGHA